MISVRSRLLGVLISVKIGLLGADVRQVCYRICGELHACMSR